MHVRKPSHSGKLSDKESRGKKPGAEPLGKTKKLLMHVPRTSTAPPKEPTVHSQHKSLVAGTGGAGKKSAYKKPAYKKPELPGNAKQKAPPTPPRQPSPALSDISRASTEPEIPEDIEEEIPEDIEENLGVLNSEEYEDDFEPEDDAGGGSIPEFQTDSRYKDKYDTGNRNHRDESLKKKGAACGSQGITKAN